MFLYIVKPSPSSLVLHTMLPILGVNYTWRQNQPLRPQSYVGTNGIRIIFMGSDIIVCLVVVGNHIRAHVGLSVTDTVRSEK